MAIQDGALLTVQVDGDECDYITSVHLKTDGGKIPIYTLKGKVMFAKGAGKLELSIGYSVPVGGFEVNFQKFAAELGRHTIQIDCGGNCLIAEGEFLTDSIGRSANAATEGTCDWQGELSSFSDA
jgi:hypothetical protein